MKRCTYTGFVGLSDGTAPRVDQGVLYPDDAQVVTERPDLFVDVDLLPPGPTQPVNEPPAVDADPPPTPTQPVDEPPAEDVDQVPPGPTESVDESAPAPTKRARRRG